MATAPLNKAFRYALNGDFRTIWDSVVSQSQPYLPDTVEFISDEDTPTWLPSSETQQLFRLTETDYSAVLADTVLTFSPEMEIEKIELPIVSIDKVDKISIRQIEDSSGTILNEDTIQLDHTFDYPPVLWKPFEPSNNGQSVHLQVEMNSANTPSNLLSRVVSKFRPSSRAAATKIGSPAVVPTRSQPPVILISIDALRYDCREKLEPLIEELGQNAIFPSEPRTQGTWTRPSHASMFTGTHPGKHGYVGWGKGEGDKRPIDPQLTTVPELLTNTGYKCSALVSHSVILPEYGFGRGFHRFRHEGMTSGNWISRECDAKSSVNQLTDWIDRDLTSRDHSLFYFLHVFDPHYPYIPPVELLESSDWDFTMPEQYWEQREAARGEDWSYLDGYQGELRIDKQLVEGIRDWYSKSVNYTALQIATLLRHLKKVDLFDDSLIIITGDHGEEFGDRGFTTHNSLYDETIRPFMAIKPPASCDWSEREQVDTIDFFPTIAKLVGREVPDDCDGTALQAGDGRRTRITERIFPDWYNVSIEIDGDKGIFTYESNYPDRPSQSTVETGPQLKEFYRLSDVRSNTENQGNISSDKKDELQKKAEQFILESTAEYTGETTAPKPSSETRKQLKDLGYK